MKAGISWIDLTVADADGLKDFYCQVTGMEVEPVSMGDYSDYALKPPGGDAVAGVCHARGSNADIPNAWMVYFSVSDIDAAVAEAEAAGGEVVKAPWGGESWGRMAVLRDPQGAVFALFQGAADG